MKVCGSILDMLRQTENCKLIKQVMLNCLFAVCPNPQTSKNQIKVELVGDNFTELRGEIAGPPDTPYEGIPTHLHCDDLISYLQQRMIPHAKQFVFILSKVADIILKSKSQKLILLTRQRYALQCCMSVSLSSQFTGTHYPG